MSCEAAAAAARNGRWKNQMRRAAHNGCCRRVAQIRELSSVLWKLLISEELVEVLLNIEIPLVRFCLASTFCYFYYYSFTIFDVKGKHVLGCWVVLVNLCDLVDKNF